MEQQNVLKLSEQIANEPWSVTFTWREISVKVQLHNGEDLLKIADLFSRFLTTNGIENTLIKNDRTTDTE